MQNHKDSKALVHQLYNELVKAKDPAYQEVLEVLTKVYLKLDQQKDSAPLINRLVNFLYSYGFNHRLHYPKATEEIIRELATIGNRAGLNGVYRSDYGSPNQF